MIQVEIVEDEQQERLRIRGCLGCLEETEKVKFSISEYGSGLEFLAGYRQQYDIVFMDIQMSGMDGMKTAKALRETEVCRFP